MSFCTKSNGRLIFVFLLQHSNCIHRETTLTTTHTSANDGSLALIINTTSNVWHINPKSQNSYDLRLVIKDEWAFHPNITSQISLEMNGYTPSITEEDGEFIIVFSAKNDKYFSVVIRLDNHNTLWKYYPSSTHLATTNDVYNDIIRGKEANGNDSRNRWKRVSSNDLWVDLLPRYNKALQWPLYLELVNDPINNTLLYECTVNDVVLKAQYQDAFISDENKEMDIYIMNDADDGKPFDIDWIKVQYKDNTIFDTITTINTTDIEAIFNTETEYTTDSETETVTTTERVFIESPTDIILDEFPSHNLERVNVTVMTLVVISCVFCSAFIVLALCYYYKMKDESNTVIGVNKSEYHRPSLDLSATNIESILEQKRRESVNKEKYNNKLIMSTQQYSDDDNESNDDDHKFDED